MEKILGILKEVNTKVDFRKSSNFVDDGLDSLDMIRLVAMLDEAFCINIDGLDIVPENFESLDAIACLIRKKDGSV